MVNRDQKPLDDADMRPSRELTSHILYGTDLRRPVDDQRLSMLADELLRHRLFNEPVTDYYEAVRAALASGESPALDDSQDDAAARDLLERLVVALDERRPWPARPFVALRPDDWPDLQTEPVIGSIPLRRQDVQTRLGRVFHRVGTGDRGALALRLRTGERLGLIAGESFTERRVVVVGRPDSGTALASFRALTGLPADDAPG